MFRSIRDLTELEKLALIHTDDVMAMSRKYNVDPKAAYALRHRNGVAKPRLYNMTGVAQKREEAARMTQRAHTSEDISVPADYEVLYIGDFIRSS